MALQESGEMYLESILVLSRSLSLVRAVDLSEFMGYSKASVSRAMGILKGEGYLTVQPDGAILLTDSGRAVAETIYERHTFLTRYLVGLGVPEAVASEDACRIEHVISETSFRALQKHMLEEHGI